MAKLTPYESLVYEMIENGTLTQAGVFAHAGPLAKLIAQGLVEMVRGVPTLPGGGVNADGSSRLTPPKPARPPAPPPLGQIQVRVPQLWIDELRRRSDGRGYGPVVRDILGPALEGKAYRSGKYGSHVADVTPQRRRRATG
jgi:hypothetical protein